MASLAAQFRTRFGAASLYLSTIPVGAERVNKSTEQTVTLRALLADGATIDFRERDELTERVVSSQAGLWNDVDRVSLLDAIAASAKNRRRPAQCWGIAIINVFTSAEWLRWKENGPRGMSTTLLDIVTHMKRLGAINLCEYDKKTLTAMWLHLRGDGMSCGSVGRDLAGDCFKKEFARQMRDCRPATYHLTLPSDHGGTTPEPEDVAAIMLLDSAMNCRGGSSSAENMFGQQQQLAIAQQQQQQQQQQQPPMGQNNPIMQMLLQAMGMQGMQGMPGFQVCGQPYRPGTGRPMRSVENAKEEQLPEKYRNPPLNDSVGSEAPPPALKDSVGSDAPPPPLKDSVGADASDELDEVQRRMLARASKLAAAAAGASKSHAASESEDFEVELPTPKGKGSKKNKQKTMQ